jgi:nucleoside-triphosphatase THEP1
MGQNVKDFSHAAGGNKTMHVFLSGLRGVGKTTIITKVVNGVVADGTVSADEIAGFRTVWLPRRGAEPGAGDDGTGFVGRHIGADSSDAGIAADSASEKRAADALYILPYEAERPVAFPASITRYRPVAERGTANRAPTIHTEVFDEDGAAIVQAAAGSPVHPKLIIMDEVGFMESGAYAFRKAVMDTLGGDVPVLGVMRWERNPFLDEIGALEKVKIIEVNEFNRDALPKRLTEQIFHG